MKTTAPFVRIIASAPIEPPAISTDPADEWVGPNARSLWRFTLSCRHTITAAFYRFAACDEAECWQCPRVLGGDGEAAAPDVCDYCLRAPCECPRTERERREEEEMDAYRL